MPADAAAYLARAEWRSRRTSALALAVVAGLAAAVAIGAFAAARRGPDAYARLLAFNNSGDGAVLLNERASIDDIDALGRSVDGDPGIAGWSLTAFSYLASPDGQFFGGTAPIAGTADLERPGVLRGRLPDPTDPYELALTVPTARTTGLDVGAELDLGVFGREQADAIADGDIDGPAHGVHTFTVVGVIVRPFDIGFESDEENEVLWSAGLWPQVDGDLAAYGVGAGYTLVPGATAEEVNERIVAGRDDLLFSVVGNDHEADFAKAAQTVAQQANALRVFGALVAVTAAILLAQAVRRQLQAGLLAQRVLGAVGLDPRGRRLATLLWALPFAGVAGAVAVVGAVAGSPLGPVGVARDGELAPGVRADALVLVAGVLVLVAVVVAASLLTGEGARPTPLRRRPARLVAAAPSAATGIGVCLAATHARARSGTRTSLGAMVLAAVVVAAVAAFGASLDRATTAPDAYGWTFDVSVAECASPECTDDAYDRLQQIDGIAAASGLATTADGTLVGIDHPVEAAIVDPRLGWAAGRIRQGRAPQADDEIVLGPGTAREAGVGVGDVVEAGAGGGVPVPFTVVGLFDPPTAFFDDSPIDEGMAATRDGVRRTLPAALQDVLDDAVPSQWFLVDIAPVADRDAVLAALGDAFPGSMKEPFRPDRLEAAYHLRSLPLLLGALVAALGVGGLLHVAAVSTVRRRSVLATLQAIGFRRSQVRTAVLTELVLLTAATVLVATPVGVALGRVAWRAAADGLGSPAAPVVPVATIAAAVLATLAMAAVVGEVAGAIAARVRPADGLRT